MKRLNLHCKKQYKALFVLFMALVGFAQLKAQTPLTSANLIGNTTNWENNDPAPLANAFDGDFNTFVDGWENWGFVGYDFGEDTGATVAAWKYAPRAGYADRLNGTELRGSNSSNFLNEFVVLDTITSDPAEGVLTEAAVNAAETYRYVYWFGRAFTYSNIAELQLLDADGNPLTGTHIGQEGGSQWCAECTYDKAFDGDIETYVEGPQTIGFVGYDFGSDGQSIFAWGYAPRPGWANRLSDGQGYNTELRGSNDPNYLNNYTVLYTITETPTENALTQANIAENNGPWRYVYWSGGVFSYGNIAELELYSAEINVPPTVEITSSVSGSTAVSPIPVTITFSESVTGFEIDDITVGAGVADNLQEVTPGIVWIVDVTPAAAGVVTVDIAANVVTDADGAGNEAAAQFSIVYETGTEEPITSANLIGSTTNWPNNDPAQLTNAFDGDFNTFVDGWENWGFVGYDFGEGAGAAVVAWKYAPRTGYGDRLNGTQLRGSNSSNFLNEFVVLDSITSDPPDSLLTEAAVNAAEAYRYVYWFGGGFTYSNIAELQLLDADGNPLTGTPIGQEGGSQWCAECTYDKAFDGDFGTYVEGPQSIGFVGYDFGSDGQSILAWGYAPRPGWANRLSDGQGYNTELRGSNDPNYLNNYTVLYTITETPAENVLTQANITENNGPWRYVYWSGGVFSYGNIAELELYSAEINVAPTVEITSSLSGPTNVTPIPVTITFSESVSGFDLSDITVGNGTADNLQEVTPGTVWTMDVAPSAEGFVTVDIAADVVTDADGKGNNSAAQFSIFYVAGTEEPITSDNLIGSTTNWENNDPAQLTNAFDGNFNTFIDGWENWGFIGYDFGEVAGATVAAWKYAPRTGFADRLNGTELRASNSSNFLNEFVVLDTITTIPEEGVLTEAAIDAAAEYRYVYWFGPAFTYSNIAELQLLDADGNPLVGTPIGQEGGSQWCAECTYDKAFDGDIETYVEGPITIGFVGYDFGAGKGASLTSWKYAPRPGWANRMSDGQGYNTELRGSNDPNYLNNYTVLYTVTETPPEYALTTGAITDDSPYRYVYWSGGVVSYGNIAELELYGAVVDNDPVPTIEITSVIDGATNISPFPVTITFSENVTGFDAQDITIGNGVIYSLQEITPGKVWTAYIIPLTDGVVTVDIAADIVTDPTGNGNEPATQFSILYDTKDPVIEITSSASESTDVSPIPVTITSSEMVIGFDIDDIAVSNGTAGNLQEDTLGRSWTVDITPADNGVVTVDVAANAVIDAAGNGNDSATQFSIVYDKAVGIREVLKQKASVKPNPASDFVLISAEDFDWVEIYNLFGQPIQKLKGEADLRVDVGRFNSGIYFVRFLYNNLSVTQKLIIE